MIVLADTGALLRLADPADPWHGIVAQAGGGVRGRGDGLTIGCRTRSSFGTSVPGRPRPGAGGGLDIAEADRRFRAVEAAVSLLTELPFVYGIWRRLVVAHAVLGKQVHDARFVALMMAHGVTHVLTLNAGDFARFPGIVEIAPASLAARPSHPPPAAPPRHLSHTGSCQSLAHGKEGAAHRASIVPRAPQFPSPGGRRFAGGRVRGLAFGNETALADRLDKPNCPSIMIPTSTT